MVEAKFYSIVKRETKVVPVNGMNLSKEEWDTMSYDERWAWWKEAEKSIFPPEGMWLISFRTPWGTITSESCSEEEFHHPRWGRIIGPTFVGNA